MGSFTYYVRTKMVKIGPPTPLYAHTYALPRTPPPLRTYFSRYYPLLFSKFCFWYFFPQKIIWFTLFFCFFVLFFSLQCNGFYKLGKLPIYIYNVTLYGNRIYIFKTFRQYRNGSKKKE